MTIAIEHQIAANELRLAGGVSCPRPQPRQEHVEREGLGDIVVGSRVEALHDVTISVARREQENGRVDLRPAKTAGDFEAVQSGKHHVENNRIETLLVARLDGGSAVAD